MIERMSGSPLVIIAFDPDAVGRADVEFHAIPISLLDEAFGGRVVERSLSEGRHSWLIRCDDDPQVRDFELSFDAEDGMASSALFYECYIDDWLNHGIFKVLSQTPSFLFAEGTRPAVAQAALAPHLPRDFIRDFGTAFVLQGPDDLDRLPESPPRTPQPAAMASFLNHARSKQARVQNRHRFHNLVLARRARTLAAATPGEPRAEELAQALSSIAAASWPPDAADWTERVTETLERVAGGRRFQDADDGCGGGVMGHPLDEVARELALLRGEDERIASGEAAPPWKSGAVAVVTQDEIAALFGRLASLFAWRLGEAERSFADDLYLRIGGDRMFDVHRIERPPVNVGSLHDDIAELRKVVADPDRLVTPVDVERVGRLLLAIAARM
jgi:hypothetical protein